MFGDFVMCVTVPRAPAIRCCTGPVERRNLCVIRTGLAQGRIASQWYVVVSVTFGGLFDRVCYTYGALLMLFVGPAHGLLLPNVAAKR